MNSEYCIWLFNVSFRDHMPGKRLPGSPVQKGWTNNLERHVGTLTRALLGLWISHRLLGGAFERPPPWSRLMVVVEKNERHRSKAREKSFRNHFGHFWAQVKIGVSRGQNSKIFQNGFSTIKSLILKIEQRIWYHPVCLVKARRTIYKITLKGQGQSLTSGQVRPRSRDDRNGSYCISVDSPGQDERTDTNPTSLSLFDQKLLANDGWWPRVTFGGVGNAIFYSNCPQLSYTIWFHSKTLTPK